MTAPARRRTAQRSRTRPNDAGRVAAELVTRTVEATATWGGTPGNPPPFLGIRTVWVVRDLFVEAVFVGADRCRVVGL
jgi:hypothetical protein